MPFVAGSREAKASRKKKPPVIQAPPAADTQAVKQAKTRAENFAKSIRADVPRIRFDSEEQMRRIANITIKKGLPEGAHIIITAARKQIAEKVGHQGKDFTDWRTFYDAGASSDLDLVLGAQAGAGATRKSPQPADILPVGADISQLTLGPRVADTIKEIDEKFVEPSVKFTGDSGDRIENMSRAYLSEYGRYPSPDTAMLLTLYTPPWLKTIDDYRNVLRPGGNIVIPERPEYEGAQDISFGPGTGDTLRAFFKNPYQPSYRDIGKLEVEPPDVEAIEDALKFINVKPPYRPFSSYAEERGQLIRDLSLALTGRPSNEWTPELDSQLRSLVFRGALAFNLFATDEQMKDKSSKLLEFASKGALGDDANLVPVIEAMRFSADPENSDKYTEAIREVAYDGFIEYQTKINKKPEWQAEYEYAKTFGYGNMPAKDAEDVKERLEWFTHYISYIKWPFQKAKEGLQIAGRETREALIEVGEWVAEPLEDVAIRIDNELMERHPEEWKAVKKAMVEWYEATDKYVVEPVIAAVSWFARKVREGMANIGKAYTAYDEFMNRIMTTAYFSLTDDSPNSVGKSWNMAEGVRFTDEVLDDLGIDHEAYPTFANTANFVGAIGRDIFVWKGVRGVAATGGKAAYKAARAAHGPVEMGTKTQPVEVLEPISAQVGKPHRVKSPSGYYTRVAEVTIDGKPVEVDAGIAEFVDRLNKGGYRTYGSHSPLKSDHPIVKTNTGKTVAHPARDVKSYIEFEKGVDTETLSEIAKKHGLETEISPEGRLIVRSPFTGARGRGKWSAFTRDALEARPPEIVEMPIGVKGLWDWILVNNSEAIAFGTNPGDEYIIKKLWGIAQVESERANSQIQLMVKSMARSKDPTQVRFALQQLAEFHDQIIDPDMPGLWKMAKMKIYRDGLNAAMPTILQMATDFIHIGNDSPMYNADDSIYLIGRSVKMGKQDWTPADARELKRLASRMYLAKNDIERLKIFHEFDELIISRLSEQPATWTVRVGNKLVRKHGTMWDYYNHWRYAVYRHASRELLGVNVESVSPKNVGSTVAYYGKKEVRQGPGGPVEVVKEQSLVVPASTTKKLRVAVANAEREFNEVLQHYGLNSAQAKAAQKALEDARQQFEDFLKASEIMAKSSATEQEMAWAARVIENYIVPKPFEYAQLMKTYTHEFNPHMLARFMASPLNRTWERVQAFSIGGSFMPTTIEGVTKAYKAVVMSNLGFPLRVTLGDEAIRLIPEGIAWGAIKSLIRTGRGEAGNLRLAGLLDEQTRDKIHGGLVNMLAQDLSRETVMVLPGMKGHYAGYQRMLRRLRDDPMVELWRKHGATRGSAEKAYQDAIAALKQSNPVPGSIADRLQSFVKEVERQFSLPGEPNRQTLEWLKLWRDRLERIETHHILRKAYANGHISRKDYLHVIRGTPDLLEPVPTAKVTSLLRDAPEYAPSTAPGPIGALTAPFAYIGERITYPMLEKLSDMMREAAWAHKFNIERNRLIALRGGAENISEEMMGEINSIAKQRAFNYVDKVMYSHSTTVLEDSLRNIFLFLPAYRQFISYWGRLYARQPLTMTGAKVNYPFGGGFESTTINLGSIPGLRLIPGAENLSIRPPIGPFWADQDEPGAYGFAKSIVPNFGPVPGLVIWYGGTALGVDMDELSSWPAMTFVNQNRGFIPKVADLLYGFGVYNFPILNRMQDARERMAFNIGIAQIREGYEADPNAAVDAMHEAGKDWIWRITESLPLVKRPEGVISAALKQFAPVSTFYLPKRAQDMLDAYYKYKQAREARDYDAEMKVYEEYPDFFKIKEYERLRLTDGKAATEMLRENPWIAIYVLPRKNIDTDKMALDEDERDPLVRLHAFDGTSDTAFSSGYKSFKEYRRQVGKLLADIRNAPDIGSAQKEYHKRYKEGLALAQKIALRITGGKKNHLYNILIDRWKNGALPTIDPQTGMVSYTNQYPFNQGKVANYIPQAMLKEYRAKEEREGVVDDVRPGEATLEKYAVLESVLDKNTVERLRAITSFSEDIQTFYENVETDINKAKVAAAVSGYWDIDSSYLRMIGFKNANEKTDRAALAVMKAYQEYEDFKKAHGDSWNNEVKAAKARFQEKKDAIFRKHAPFLAGGTVERVKRTGVLNTPHILWAPKNEAEAKILRRNADKLDAFLKAGFRMLLDPKTPKSENKLAKMLNDYYARQPEFVQVNAREYVRAKLWDWYLTECSKARSYLKNKYNEYNKSKGWSLYSSVGEKVVRWANKTLDAMIIVEPAIKKDVETYFGKGRNVGATLLDWVK